MIEFGFSKILIFRQDLVEDNVYVHRSDNMSNRDYNTYTPESPRRLFPCRKYICEFKGDLELEKELFSVNKRSPFAQTSYYRNVYFNFSEFFRI